MVGSILIKVLIMQQPVPQFTLRGMMIATAVVAILFAVASYGSVLWMAIAASLIELAVVILFLRAKSNWVPIAAVAWLLMGAVVILQFLGIPKELPLVLVWFLAVFPATPFYVIESGHRLPADYEGLLWYAVHRMPVLNTLGIIVVYILPASIGIWRWVRKGKGGKREKREPREHS